MRTRFWFGILVLVFATLFVALWPRSQSARSPSIANQDVVLDNRSTAQANFPASPSSQASDGAVFKRTNEAVKQKEERLQGKIAAMNAPISFYGEVVDQAGEPVAGAKVLMTVEHPLYVEGGLSNTNIRTEALTDPAGRFEWTGIDGHNLTVESVQKPGFEPSQNTFHTYGQSSGDLASPVIFRMWKKGEKAQLVANSQFWHIIPDGRVYTVDLVQGTSAQSPSAQGDFRIAVLRPAAVLPRERYDWSFEITPIDGGIIQTEDDLMYEAPDNGYASRFDFRLTALDTNWMPDVKENFYVKARGGQEYARIKLEVIPEYQEQAVLNISYAVNPTGQRNLQP